VQVLRQEIYAREVKRMVSNTKSWTGEVGRGIKVGILVILSWMREAWDFIVLESLMYWSFDKVGDDEDSERIEVDR
jgi:hypothetical protein